MKKISILLIAFLFLSSFADRRRGAGSASAAASVLEITASSGGAPSMTLPAGTNFLIAVVVTNSAGTLSDSKGNSWTEQSFITGSVYINVWWATNTHGSGVDALTTTGVSRWVTFMGWKTTLSGTIDTKNSTNVTSGTIETTLTTPSGANEINLSILGTAVTMTSSSISSPIGTYTVVNQEYSGTFYNNDIEYYINPTSTGTQPIYTVSASSPYPYGVVNVYFK